MDFFFRRNIKTKIDSDESFFEVLDEDSEVKVVIEKEEIEEEVNEAPESALHLDNNEVKKRPSNTKYYIIIKSATIPFIVGFLAGMLADNYYSSTSTVKD